MSSPFRSIPISSIWYNRADRQRQDLGDLNDLAASISAIGLLNPPIVTREGQLIAGERRLAACRQLGWSAITVQYMEDLSELDREQIELDENIKRKDLDWQEKTRAIARYHELCIARNGPDWSEALTARALGFTDSYVNRQVRVAKALADGHRLVVEAPTFSTARGIVERLDARKKDGEGEALAKLLAPVIAKYPDESNDEPDDLCISLPEEAYYPILNEDFIDWAATYRGPKFNLIHCDFPYGIDANKHDQGGHVHFGGYSDTPEVFQALLAALSLAMENVIAPSAHMLFWYAPKTHGLVHSALVTMGWTVNPTPLIWHRSDNAGIIPDPRRMPRQVYEAALLCSRGDRFLVQARSNLIPATTTKDWHPSEKPVAVLEHFLSMLVDDTSRVLDPTCGSGNSLIVANRLGAAEVLGLEVDPDFHQSALRNWKENVE